MEFVALVGVAYLILLAIRRRRRAGPTKRHVPAAVRVSLLLDRAGMGHLASRLGINPGFGFLQHRVLGAAMELRTISVRGTARLPGALDVDIADDDWPVVAAAPDAFLQDIVLVLRSEAAEHGWEICGQLDLRFATLGEATAGRPVVAVALHRNVANSPTSAPVAVARLSAPMPSPAELPPTLDFTDLSPTVHAPGLVLHPLHASGLALQLGSADSDVVLGRIDGVDLVVPHPTVSARQCRLFRGPDGTWEIADLQSKNGTWVNASRVRQPVPLRLGDVVVLGTVRYEVASL